MMSKIIPAILAISVADLETKLAQLPKEIIYVHLDVLENDVWTPINIDFEVHLMVREPEKIIDRWIERGAKRVIIHSLGGSTAKWAGIEIGLGVELSVSLESITPLVSQVDFIHLMSIDALGTQGDDFEPIIFDRIKVVREKFPNIKISVDGGISKENYQKLISVGADRLIVGSGFKDLWNSLTKK